MRFQTAHTPNSLTEGPIAQTLIAFALPLFLGNLFQQLYNTADSLIVGNFLGSEALAAVSSSGNLIFLMVGLVNGVSMGAGVVIARYFGAKDYDRIQKTIHTLLAFGLVAGALLTVILLAKGMNYLLQKHHSTVSHVIIGIILAATLPIIPFAGFVSSVQSGITNALCLIFGVAAALLLDRFNRKVDVPDSAA